MSTFDTPMDTTYPVATTLAEHEARTAHHDPPRPGGGTAEHGEPRVLPADDPDAWRRHAACSADRLGLSPRAAANVMHPIDEAGRAEAKAICRTCPVRDDCLEHALDHHENDGVWGGLTDYERRQVRRKRATA